MAQDWRTLKLEILAETGDFIKGMSKANSTTESFGDKLKDFGKKAALAFAAAATAAGVYATKLISEGVKAAIEDEAAQTRLAQALKATTNATEAQVAQVEKSIRSMSLATGVADDNLRPAFTRLATATGSITEAQKSLQLALDISARTGKDVEAVSNALAKAYEGNTGALGRLGVGLSTAEMKTLGLEGTIARLTELMGGAAAAQAGTLEGKIAIMQNRFNEAKETIGTAFLPVVINLLDVFNTKLAPAIDNISNSFGGENGLLARVREFIAETTEFLRPEIEAIQQGFEKVTKAITDNKANFEDLLAFIKTAYEFFRLFFVPFLKSNVVSAIEGIATAFSFVIKVVTPIIGAISDLLNGLLSLINRVASALNNLITRFNSIPVLPSLPFGGGSSNTRRTSFDDNMANRTGDVVINVNSPSIIDETGFARAVQNAINNSQSRGTYVGAV